MADSGNPGLDSAPDGQSAGQQPPAPTQNPANGATGHAAPAQPSNSGRSRPRIYAEEPEDGDDTEGYSSDDSIPDGDSPRFATDGDGARSRPRRRRPLFFEPVVGKRHVRGGDRNPYASHPSQFYGATGASAGMNAPYYDTNPFASAPPQARHNSYPYAGYFPPQPPPPSRHHSSPFPAGSTFNPFAPKPAAPAAATPQYAYGPGAGTPAAHDYAANPFSPNQYAHPSTYPPTQHAPTSSGGYYPPRSSHGAKHGERSRSRHASRSTAPQPQASSDIRRIARDLESVKMEQHRVRAQQEQARETADRQDKRTRDEASKKDLERIVKHHVRAEMRKRMQPRDFETQSDPGRRRLEWENRLLLEGAMRQQQQRLADDNQSLSSRGSRREMETDQILHDIVDLVEERVRRKQWRQPQDGAPRSTGMELVRREPRYDQRAGQSGLRREVFDMVQDALRQFRLEDTQGTGSAPGDRLYPIGLPTYEDEEQDRAPIPPAVPQPPNQDYAQQRNDGQRGGPAYPYHPGPGPMPIHGAMPGHYQQHPPPMAQQPLPPHPPLSRAGSVRRGPAPDRRPPLAPVVNQDSRPPDTVFDGPHPFIRISPPAADNGNNGQNDGYNARESPGGQYPPPNDNQAVVRNIPPQPSRPSSPGRDRGNMANTPAPARRRSVGGPSQLDRDYSSESEERDLYPRRSSRYAYTPRPPPRAPAPPAPSVQFAVEPERRPRRRPMAYVDEYEEELEAGFTHGNQFASNPMAPRY